MSLSELTSREAILAALREFDGLGRDGFLSKYGFRAAREYFLEHRGSRYDSKAIAGVAHGIQHPHLGPLPPSDFSGGEATVKKRLEELGFRIIRSTGSDSQLWALCANPARYRIREAVQHLEVDYWLVGRAAIGRGDRVAIWQTLDAERHRGIVALGHVIGEPELRRDDQNPYWTATDDGEREDWRVPVQYQALIEPLWVDDSERGQFLASLSVARAQGGTAFHVTPEQWSHLSSLIGAFTLDEFEGAEVESVIRTRGRHARGQGFGLSQAERAAVEHYAMDRARKSFASRWPSVKDVSSSCSFDLLCQSATAELRVEVKGTTSQGEQIILTRREIDEARLPGYALFVA